MIEFQHGGTDAGPPPRSNFSSNANPLGPNPHVLKALRSVDPAHYPDPDYTSLRQTLASFHGVRSSQIIVGAGASELILRLVRRYPGSILTLSPTFSEYTRCARVEGLAVLEAKTPDEFLRLQSQASLAFVCQPNNPTGQVWESSFLEQAAKQGRLVLDLAYSSLCNTTLTVPSNAIQLHAPNKAHGVTGLRAAYAVLPEADDRLRLLASSWVLDVFGEKFLHSMTTPAAQAWLGETRQQLWQWRADLSTSLEGLGLNTSPNPNHTNFLLVQLTSATTITATLRHQGIKIRDCASFGLPDCVRLSVQLPAENQELLVALAPLLISAIESDHTYRRASK